MVHSTFAAIQDPAVPTPPAATVAVARRAGRAASDGIVPGLAFFLGTFALVNVLGALIVPTFDANIWWIDITPVTRYAQAPLFALLGIALIAHGVRPASGGARRIATAALVALALVAAVFNVVGFYTLLANGELAGAFPLPFSLFIASVLAAILAALTSSRTPARTPRRGIFAATVAGCVLLFPVFQMFCFGRTDYRRAADAIVVLGAKAFADGTPSLPLAERVRTAAELYRAGLAPRLIFSGGPGDGAFHETEAMRMMAMRLGVPAAAIMLDKGGVNTQATVDDTAPMLRAIGARRVMVVSHFYHLPRIKMAYQREGLNVFTVPAQETYGLLPTTYNMAREIGGLWVYYVSALWR
jgi:uncharacterized SAM-binding protein YcdF (DUF218 family)